MLGLWCLLCELSQFILMASFVFLLTSIITILLPCLNFICIRCSSILSCLNKSCQLCLATITTVFILFSSNLLRSRTLYNMSLLMGFEIIWDISTIFCRIIIARVGEILLLKLHLSDLELLSMQLLSNSSIFFKRVESVI